MSATDTRSVLRNLLLTEYDDLTRRLGRRLGSSDAAEDALQDAFLRIETGREIGPVRSPRAYLIRMVINIAANRAAADRRRLTSAEIDAVLEIPDEAPDPERSVSSRLEVAALRRAMRELPARRRAIVHGAWIEDTSHAVLAQRFGVSVRTIQIELKLGLEHCAKKLHRDAAK